MRKNIVVQIDIVREPVEGAMQDGLCLLKSSKCLSRTGHHSQKSICTQLERERVHINVICCYWYFAVPGVLVHSRQACYFSGRVHSIINFCLGIYFKKSYHVGTAITNSEWRRRIWRLKYENSRRVPFTSSWFDDILLQHASMFFWMVDLAASAARFGWYDSDLALCQTEIRWCTTWKGHTFLSHVGCCLCVIRSTTHKRSACKWSSVGASIKIACSSSGMIEGSD